MKEKKKVFLPILPLASNQIIPPYEKKKWSDFKDLTSFTGLQLPKIDNVTARFGSLIDHTEFELFQNYFAKYLRTPTGLKCIELELNA